MTSELDAATAMWEELEDDTRSKWLLSLSGRGGDAGVSGKARVFEGGARERAGSNGAHDSESNVAALVCREVLRDTEQQEAKDLTQELDSMMQRLSREGGEATRRRLEIGYLSPLVADDPEEAQRHLTVVDEDQIEKKRPRADRPGPSEDEGVERPLLRAAARHIPEDLQKSKAVLYKKARAGDSSRRRVVRLDETPPEQRLTKLQSTTETHNPTKKWSLRDVFGDKLNLVDGDRRALLEAFLNKRQKPPSADTNRVKIHEENATDPATGQITKTTLYVLLDWEKHSYQKTRKLKVVPPVMAPVPAGLATETSSQRVESAAP